MNPTQSEPDPVHALVAGRLEDVGLSPEAADGYALAALAALEPEYEVVRQGVAGEIEAAVRELESLESDIGAYARLLVARKKLRAVLTRVSKGGKRVG